MCIIFRAGVNYGDNPISNYEGGGSGIGERAGIVTNDTSDEWG